MKTIRICTLVRNRDWIIPLYLEHLYNLNYDKKLITIHWVVNNSNDLSLNQLQSFKNKYHSEYNKIIIEEINKSNLPEDIRTKKVRYDSIYSHLSELRNYLFNNCKEDYLFNIDSDILVEKDTLVKLLKHEKDMISSWIYNAYDYSQYNSEYKYWNHTNLLMAYKITFRGLERIVYKPLKKIDIRRNLRDNNELIEIDLTGAICLYSKKLYSDKNVRFYNHIDGEDHSYCILAKKQGYKMYSDLTCYSQHIMNEYWLEKYKNNEKIS